MTRSLYFYSGIIALILGSCKKPVGVLPVNSSQLNITIQPYFGAGELYLDSTYTTAEGYDVQFTAIKFYMEDLRGSTGDSTIAESALFDYAEGTDFVTGATKPENVVDFHANLGVGPALNHNDPSALPLSSPLNILNADDMHWNWNPGYIFVKVEARVDTIQDGNPLFDHPVVFHVGKDPNLQTLSFMNVQWQDQGNNIYFLPLKVDMATFLQNGAQIIDLKTEFTSHSAPGQEALTLKVMENFKAAISPM